MPSRLKTGSGQNATWRGGQLLAQSGHCENADVS
jgi:hypothetical protein